MDWSHVKPVINSPTSTIQEKFDIEQEYWNNAAPILVGPLKQDEFGRLLTEAINDLININVPSVRMLDFGCGTGRIYKSLLPQCKYIGMDISASYLKIFQDEFPQLELVQINTQKIPEEYDNFDIITCYSVFTHIPSGDQCELALSELYRVLKPKGILLVSIFQDITAAPTCNWTTYSSEYWKSLIASQGWREHKITPCYECSPQICQSLYTLVK